MSVVCCPSSPVHFVGKFSHYQTSNSARLWTLLNLCKIEHQIWKKYQWNVKEKIGLMQRSSIVPPGEDSGATIRPGDGAGLCRETLQGTSRERRDLPAFSRLIPQVHHGSHGCTSQVALSHFGSATHREQTKSHIILCDLWGRITSKPTTCSLQSCRAWISDMLLQPSHILMFILSKLHPQPLWFQVLYDDLGVHL